MEELELFIKRISQPPSEINFEFIDQITVIDFGGNFNCCVTSSELSVQPGDSCDLNKVSKHARDKGKRVFTV